MQLSLCLEMVFKDRSFGERAERAAALGLAAVEFWSWRDKRLEEIAAAAEANGLEVAAFSGNREYSLVDERDHEDLCREVAAAMRAALRLRCPSLMLLTDTLDAEGRSRNAGAGGGSVQQRANVLAALKRLGPMAAQNGLTLLLEPLNTVIDHGGYFLTSSAEALGILEEVNHPSVQLLYDVYHMRTMGEVVADHLPACAGSGRLGHVHAAGVPGRGALDSEYTAVAAGLRRAGYHGYVGLEFAPASHPEEAIRAALKIFSPSSSLKANRA